MRSKIVQFLSVWFVCALATSLLGTLLVKHLTAASERGGDSLHT